MQTPLLASVALQLPVRLHGIQLGRPTDIILDAESWQTIGFVVLCGDETTRFLPYAACQRTEEEIRVASALMLLEDVGFYEKRGVSFRSLLDGDVLGGGVFRDAALGPTGRISELVVEVDGIERRVHSAGAVVVPTRASAA